MPAGQPFTKLCQLLAQRPIPDRADLHLHTNHSDGEYTPAELVSLGVRAGLQAIAVTDHDTMSGVPLAHSAAQGTSVEVVAGVEISAAYREREIHLLGYFVALDHEQLNAALALLCRCRGERFREMIDRLHDQGVTVEPGGMADRPAVGRRHLAELLVQQGKASTVREAFQRYLLDGARAVAPKVLLPVAEAITLVRQAGGVASLAHPPEWIAQSEMSELREMGMEAVEAEYPSARPRRRQQLREWATQLGLAVSGGSDCHGPATGDRTVGGRSISSAEFVDLRKRAARFNAETRIHR